MFRVGDLWARLMKDRLGYERLGAHGENWRATVTEELARSHCESVVAIHLTDVPFGDLFQKPDVLHLPKGSSSKSMSSGFGKKAPTPSSKKGTMPKSTSKAWFKVPQRTVPYSAIGRSHFDYLAGRLLRLLR